MTAIYSTPGILPAQETAQIVKQILSVLNKQG